MAASYLLVPRTSAILSAPVLPRTFYDRSPDLVARDLLGHVLVRVYGGELLAGRIIEAEAYLGLQDPASHAAVGRTARNAVLFGPPGRAYVYRIYGMHNCLDISCLPDGDPGGVLLRALTPLHGAGTMAQLRQVSGTPTAKVLTGGPARICEAMHITTAADNGVDMTRPDSHLRIVDDGFRPAAVTATPRIGITKAADQLLRFLALPEAPRRP